MGDPSCDQISWLSLSRCDVFVLQVHGLNETQRSSYQGPGKCRHVFLRDDIRAQTNRQPSSSFRFWTLPLLTKDRIKTGPLSLGGASAKKGPLCSTKFGNPSPQTPGSNKMCTTPEENNCGGKRTGKMAGENCATTRTRREAELSRQREPFRNTIRRLGGFRNHRTKTVSHYFSRPRALGNQR